MLDRRSLATGVLAVFVAMSCFPEVPRAREPGHLKALEHGRARVREHRRARVAEPRRAARELAEARAAEAERQGAAEGAEGQRIPRPPGPKS